LSQRLSSQLLLPGSFGDQFVAEAWPYGDLSRAMSWLFFIFPLPLLSYAPAMSSSSRAKKVKPKNTVRELKLVHSISRRGVDVLKMEEVKTPKKKTALASRHSGSSSPIKRPKLEPFNPVGISDDLEEFDTSGKRFTLVFLSQPCLKALSKNFRAKTITWGNS